MINLQQRSQKYTEGKDSLSSKWCWENCTATYMQKNETGPLYYTIHKNRPKWIKDLYIRPETIKLLIDKH